jgi:hypothetical protein
VLLPVVIAIAGALDTSSRFVPVDVVGFRAWEVMFNAGPPGSPFAADARYFNPDAYGDLASIGNLPALRQRHAERFTTDASGFRITTGPASSGPPEVLLLGDSFFAGSSLSDDETLSSQLAAQSGLHVYDAAGLLPDLDRALTQIQRLGMDHGVVLIEHLNGRTLPALHSPWPEDPSWDLCARTAGRIGLAAPCRQFARGPSAAKVWAHRLLQAVQDGRVLPNPELRNVAIRQLRNGDDMLFLPVDATRSYDLPQDERIAAAEARIYGQWSDALRQRGLSLLVVLIPDKYEVYAPLFANPERPADSTYLGVLQRALSAGGIASVDLTAPLSAAAAAGIDRHEYVFWPDDTHWKPVGVTIATREILASGELR